MRRSFIICAFHLIVSCMGEHYNCSAGKKFQIPYLLWKLKVHHLVHTSPTLDPTLSQINPDDTPMHYFLTSILISPIYAHKICNG
jgi:hypothetical protein